jgi:hypothetical protein
MSRALVAGGSLGGLTAALVLRDQGTDVEVLECSAGPLQDRGAGIVTRPATVRYLFERLGKPISDIGVPASRLRCGSGRLPNTRARNVIRPSRRCGNPVMWPDSPREIARMGISSDVVASGHLV